MSMIVSAVSGIMAFIGLVVFVIVRDLKKPRKDDAYSLIGMKARISSVIPSPVGGNGNLALYSIKVHGEVWKAEGPQDIEVGEEVVVTQENKEKMLLKINKSS